jgi:hypothetical protein
MTPEERKQALEDMRAKMTPEERAKWDERMKQRGDGGARPKTDGAGGGAN